MRKIIREFSCKYGFLSNFYPVKILYNGLEYQNAEAAFQGQKPFNKTDRKNFCTMGASQAKAAGRQCYLRKDWEEVKDQIMYEVVMAKFTQNIFLKNSLLETGNAELIEGTSWNDLYWGIDLYSGNGLNHLGQILEKVREELGGWKRDYEEPDWLKKIKKIDSNA